MDQHISNMATLRRKYPKIPTSQIVYKLFLPIILKRTDNSYFIQVALGIR